MKIIQVIWVKENNEKNNKMEIKVSDLKLMQQE